MSDFMAMFGQQRGVRGRTTPAGADADGASERSADR